MKDFEQHEQEMEKNVITISEKEYFEKAAKAIARIAKEINKPILGFRSFPIVIAIKKELFSEKKED